MKALNRLTQCHKSSKVLAVVMEEESFWNSWFINSGEARSLLQQSRWSLSCWPGLPALLCWEHGGAGPPGFVVNIQFQNPSDCAQQSDYKHCPLQIFSKREGGYGLWRVKFAIKISKSYHDAGLFIKFIFGLVDNLSNISEKLSISQVYYIIDQIQNSFIFT